MIEQMADWVEVDESKYNEVKDARSVVIEMNVSPYDVPHQVRGGFDEGQRKFVIEFRYIDDEELREVKVDDHVHALIGRKSSRVYSLVVDVDAIGVDSVALKMGPPETVRQGASVALGAMPSRLATKKVREKNYKVADKVLGDYWSSIAKPLVAG
ncbi:hypothetical protein [Stenotrophomonas sp. AR026]|uniref:hypothetical protein n=1 Tax=Stenotrophomonas sp. AR026 TaxID=3398462 RepID=UPI003BB1B126